MKVDIIAKDVEVVEDAKYIPGTLMVGYATMGKWNNLWRVPAFWCSTVEGPCAKEGDFPHTGSVK